MVYVKLCKRMLERDTDPKNIKQFHAIETTMFLRGETGWAGEKMNRRNTGPNQQSRISWLFTTQEHRFI